MKKPIRIVSLALSLLLLVSLIPAFAAAQETAEPDNLPETGNSVFATGAAFQTIKMEFKSEFTVTNQAVTRVDLKTAAEIPVGMAGLLVKIESDGVFNFSFSPITTAVAAGHGFDLDSSQTNRQEKEEPIVENKRITRSCSKFQKE